MYNVQALIFFLSKKPRDNLLLYNVCTVYAYRERERVPTAAMCAYGRVCVFFWKQ